MPGFQLAWLFLFLAACTSPWFTVDRALAGLDTGGTPAHAATMLQRAICAGEHPALVG